MDWYYTVKVILNCWNNADCSCSSGIISHVGRNEKGFFPALEWIYISGIWFHQFTDMRRQKERSAWEDIDVSLFYILRHSSYACREGRGIHPSQFPVCFRQRRSAWELKWESKGEGTRENEKNAGRKNKRGLGEEKAKNAGWVGTVSCEGCRVIWKVGIL